MPSDQTKSPAIQRITIAGFKSIREKQLAELHPFTILAGANGSGKTSLMQPLLLLKQTMESGLTPPGALLLDGAHVYSSSPGHLVSWSHGKGYVNGFEVGFEGDEKLLLGYVMDPNRVFVLDRMEVAYKGHHAVLRPGMTHEAILKALPAEWGTGVTRAVRDSPNGKLSAVPYRCFLELRFEWTDGTRTIQSAYLRTDFFTKPWLPEIMSIIHVSGTRGTQTGVYPRLGVGETFSGKFDFYTGSVVKHFQEREEERERLAGLKSDLRLLELTCDVKAERITDTEIHLMVGRLPRSMLGEEQELISLAHAGFGVPQALPVVVALHAARRGQLVYIEQPEAHLHPRAQVAMAEVLARAVSRGVRVVVETHSELLLLGIQTLVAETAKKMRSEPDAVTLEPSDVKLHWFRRSDSGETEIISRDLDENGAFGDWPEDFADVMLRAENRYLTAVETPARNVAHG